MTRPTIDPAYFDALYAGNSDPWNFVASPYEAAKYAHTLSSLPRSRYRSAFEVGCSIGVFTRALAERCDAVLAVDVSEAALREARTRNADRPNATFDMMVLPGDRPSGPFDLVVLSEVLYFFARPDLERVAEVVGDVTAPGAHILLVHWLGETDFPLGGDEASDGFIEAAAGFARPVLAERQELYRLDLLERS